MSMFKSDFRKMSGDDVVVDHGSYNCSHKADEDEIAGHRAIYVGIHMPLKNKGQRHRHRKHRHHRSKENNTDHDGANESNSNTPLLVTDKEKERKPSEQPSQRVKFILGDESAADEEHQSHEVFTELEELYTAEDGDGLEWKETARWIKYEEDVDEGAGRWSKPHIATLSLHSLFELRNCLMNGAVCLDMDAGNLDTIADLVLEKLSNLGQLDNEKREQVKAALLEKHRHHGQKKQKKSSTALMPMIRTLTDIGRSLSSSHGHVSMEEAAAQIDSHSSSPNFHKSNSLSVDNELPDAHSSDGMVKVASGPSMKARTSFMRKIPQNAEASNVLVGEVDFLPRPIIAFVRLLHAVTLGDLTEVPIPTRFMFIMLGPPSEESSKYHEIGRCIATLMSDKVFHDVAYKAKSVEDLLAGIDEFMDQVTVLPPGVWDPNIRIEPPKTSPPPQTKRLEGFADHLGNGHVEGADGGDEHDHPGLERTGHLFGGLIQDVKRRAPHYFSDFKDALHLQCLASFIFMYFACLTPVVTFGGLLGEATNQMVSTLESLLGASACGIAYHLFSGQPLTILGSTGPILVYEKIMASVCGSLGWDYLPFRAWVGIWTMLLCIILVATDASAMVKYFTRFVEESFSTLISFIFIYEAIHKLINIYHEYPIHRFPLTPNMTEYDCECHATNETKPYYVEKIEDMWHTSLKECKQYGGKITPSHCKESEPVSDVFLMSAILMFGTFMIAYSLKMFRNTRYFPTMVRKTVSDFAVLLAVVIMVSVDLIMGIPTPKLPVPTEIKPTSNERDYWFVPLFANPWWSILVAILPALLATILIFMDQQITAVIVNRKENKLKKGVGYHLDLLIVAVMLGVCSILGLPWFVAATVLSINHVNSLRVESACKAPGETPKVVGCREQRVTGVLVFVFIGLAVFMTSILNKIAMPVLYGVFLYMGISSLKGVQFVNRITLFFMPPKHQPDYTYLRNVGLQRVHLFTFIQLTCLVILWIIKITIAALIFPIMVLGMVFVRKLMDFIFTQMELSNLDDIMPEVIKRDRHEREKKKKEQQAEEERMQQCAVPGRVQVPLSGGNVLSIPVDKVTFDPNASTINISDEMAKCGVWKYIAENSEKNTIPKHHHTDSQAIPKLETIPSSPRESTIFEVGENSSNEDFSGIRIDIPRISVEEDSGSGETPV